MWWDDNMKAWLAAKLQTLDESIKQTIKKDKQCMEKTFKGFVIPPVVDTPEGRKCVREGYQLKRNNCFVGDIGLCTGGRPCRECIACINSGDAVRKREVFEQYDRSYPLPGRFEEFLKPGVLLKTAQGNFYLWLGGKHEEAYLVGVTDLPEEGPRLVVEGVETKFLKYHTDDVEEVIGSNISGQEAVSADSVMCIMGGSCTLLAKALWVKPKPAPVKEMTVDEISKALGYKVKVVGSEKADD